MRPRSISRRSGVFLIAALALPMAGCSTGSDESFTTSSLPPRPHDGMLREPPPAYAQTGYSQPSYSRPSYQPSYQPSYAQAPYPAPAGRPAYMETGSFNRPYDPPRAPQQAYAERPYQWSETPRGSAAPAPPPQPYYGAQPTQWQPAPPRYGAPITTGSLGAKSQTVVVREGDTLYGLSRRHNIPVADLVSANRLAGGKIDVGQTLVIPR